jgi:hypothetical protein
MRMRAIGLVALLAGGIASPVAAGTWKYGLDNQDQSILTYSEDGKVTFMLSCTHSFALHVKYPGEARKQGEASIDIASGRKSMTFKGRFVDPTGEYATTFAQSDLGYDRQDPGLYEKKWEAVRDRMLNLLGSGKKLTISAGGDSYSLPPIDAKGWRKAFGECG